MAITLRTADKTNSSHSGLAKHFLDARETPESDSSTGPVLADALLIDAVEHNATDIHVDPQGDHYHIRLRIDGSLLNVVAGDNVEGQRLINQFRVLSKVDPKEVEQTESRWSATVNGRPIDLRCTFVATVDGDKLCIRIMGHDSFEVDLDNLVRRDDQCQQIRNWLDARSGMFVVVGPTGSGKSTLLYSLADELASPNVSVVTLEDPVERRCPGMTQIEVGENQKDIEFADAVKVSLRLDPDYLVVGETRGKRSARAAISATNAGRTLLTSMHGHDLPSAVNNLRAWGVDNREIASALRFVVATRLVRCLCEDCKRTRDHNDKDLNWLVGRGIEDLNEGPHAVGCSECLQTGYRGRIAIQRTWAVTREQAAQIRDNVLAEHVAPALPTFDEIAVELVRSGKTSVEELRGAGLPI